MNNSHYLRFITYSVIFKYFLIMFRSTLLTHYVLEIQDQQLVEHFKTSSFFDFNQFQLYHLPLGLMIGS